MSQVVEVVTPVPGFVAAVKVDPGASVSVGDTIAVLQAMKTEVQIAAEHDGKVASIAVKEGDEVDIGSVIATMDVEEDHVQQSAGS